jgi:hypothetical protein
VGEGWLVVHWIAASGEFADLPWYQFMGYLNERFMVCVCHAGFTGACLFLALEKRRKVGGFFAAVHGEEARLG